MAKNNRTTDNKANLNSNSKEIRTNNIGKENRIKISNKKITKEIKINHLN